MTFLVGVLILLGFIVAGLPIGFALGLAGIACLMLLVPPSIILGLMTSVVHQTASEYVLLTIPMFILMAEFLSAGGVSRDLLVACNRALRRVKGGMAIACVLAGAVLASASGSSTASAASITRAAFPAMRGAGYSQAFSVGTIAMSGTLAIMIPPSIGFVLYGIITENSIGSLFIAGIVPGVLTAIGYVITIFLVLHFRPDLGPQPEKEARLAAAVGNGRVWPITILIVIVLGGLYSGVATPTEISAFGALGALVISQATGRLGFARFNKAVGNTVRTSAMIFTIMFSAYLFGYFISFTKVTDAMLLWIAESGIAPTTVLLLVVGLYLLMGMVMDQGAIIILTAPITAPLMVGLGYDPIWWGVIIIKTAEIGLVTPPMGLNVFVASSAAGVSLREGFTGTIPFIVTELIILGLLMAYPQVSLALL